MARLQRLFAVVLIAALVQLASASVNDDRIAAREACYKDCFSRDGWDPVCAWNPAYPNETTHGGGDLVWPNMCTAQCMAKYCKYGEWCHLEAKYRVKVPAKCYKSAWDIYISLDVEAPECKVCNPKNKVAKQPPFKAFPAQQCMKACADRDGWKPLCVEEFITNKKYAFGNACAAQCSRVSSPNPLYYVKLPANCKRQFLKTGRMPKSCIKCPKGKPNINMPIDSDRVVAREACYKACISRDGWDPVCSWNPAFPKETTHGGGDTVWPNACTAGCMAEYCKYVEWCYLETKYKVKLPKVCRQRLYDIYYLTSNEPSVPEKIRKKCLTCPPPK